MNIQSNNAERGHIWGERPEGRRAERKSHTRCVPNAASYRKRVPDAGSYGP